MNAYQSTVLEGASPVELTIALYDGIVRFMNQAIEAVEQNDVDKRRASVKRAMDIVMHLQVTLDRKQGGKPAEALTEFYTAMFALMLQGSQANSRQKFEQVIANVRNVREAWKQALAEAAHSGVRETKPIGFDLGGAPTQFAGNERESSWTA
ncbi:MAG: flagellar export chaperone FliS [Acidobacteria bacterium]|nr:flagellar export chaperone FliS [Acidobacteriota bacterium]